MRLIKPAPFKEALQKLGQRTPIAADLGSAEWAQVPVARLVRILRTEQTKSTVPFEKGQKGRYPRRVNASGSVFAPVFSGVRMLTAVPHTRITGLYFFDRIPGQGNEFFLGDSENEFTYIGADLDALNIGQNAKPDPTPGTDSTKWKL